MPRTGRTIYFDELTLNPRYEAHTVTIFFKTRPQTDPFGMCAWRGRRTWLWTAMIVGNPANASCGDGRAREWRNRIQIRGYMGYSIYMGVEYESSVSCFQ